MGSHNLVSHSMDADSGTQISREYRLWFMIPPAVIISVILLMALASYGEYRKHRQQEQDTVYDIMLKRSVDTLKRLLFQGNKVYKDITENNPHERPYYKHEEKELKEQITMLEKAIITKEIKKTVDDQQQPKAGCSLTSQM